MYGCNPSRLGVIHNREELISKSSEIYDYYDWGISKIDKNIKKVKKNEHIYMLMKYRRSGVYEIML